MFEHFLVWVIRGTQTLFLIFAGLFCLKLQLGRTPLLRPLIVFVTPEPCLALAFQTLSLGAARCELRSAGDPQISQNTSTRTSAKQRAAYLDYRRAVPRKQRRLCDGFVGDRAPVLTIRSGRNDCGQRDTFSVKNLHNKTIHYGRLSSDRYLFLSKSLYSLNVLIYDTQKDVKQGFRVSYQIESAMSTTFLFYFYFNTTSNDHNWSYTTGDWVFYFKTFFSKLR